ncbi:hypothetical protein [Devosia sp. 1635]|uniref:hypothetical protein n=1 Tax=Devosia sp. 1635 TaxID=2726066 RepID=UPI001567BAC4|nr:hypothetical protein [Devosia sp. 1635]
MAEHFEQIDAQLQELASGLLADGVKPDDIAGPLMRQSVALSICADGAKATAKYLRDLARRIEDGGDIGN